MPTKLFFSLTLAFLFFAFPASAETLVSSKTGSTELYSGGSACVPAHPTNNCVYEIAQMIKVPATDTTLDELSIKMISNQPLADDVLVAIYADDTGNALPDLDHLLAVSDTVAGNTIPATGYADYVDFQFTSNNTFTANSYIWAILVYDNHNTGNSIVIGAHSSTNNSYVDGRAAYRATYASETWTALTASDLNFEATFDYHDPRETPLARFTNPSSAHSYDPLHPFLYFAVRDDVYMDEWDDMKDMEFEVRVKQGSSVLDTQSVPAVQYFSPGLPHEYYHSAYTPWDYVFTPGTYVIGVRSCYDGFTCGVWTELDITILAENGSTPDGSISDDVLGDLSDGITDFDSFVDAYPEFDIDPNTAGAQKCDLWGSDPEDGLDCIWSWIKYAIVPDGTGFSGLLKTTFGVLTTRWPIVYVITPLDSYYSGLVNGANTCWVPAFGGTTFMGASLPTIDVCSWISGAHFEDIIEDSTFISTSLLMAIWLAFGFAWYNMARRFFKV